MLQKRLMITIIALVMVSSNIFLSAADDLEQRVIAAREEARRGIGQRQQGRLLDNYAAQEITEELHRVIRAVYDDLPVSQRIFNPNLVPRYQLNQDQIQALIQEVLGSNDLGVYPTIDGFMIGRREHEIPTEDPEAVQAVARAQEQLQHERRVAFFKQLEEAREAASTPVVFDLSSFKTPSPHLRTPTPPSFRPVFSYGHAGSKREREESSIQQSGNLQSESLKIPRLYYVPGLRYSPGTPITSPHTPADTTIERSPMAPSRLSISMPPLPDSSKSPQ